MRTGVRRATGLIGPLSDIAVDRQVHTRLGLYAYSDCGALGNRDVLCCCDFYAYPEPSFDVRLHLHALPSLWGSDVYDTGNRTAAFRDQR